MADDAHTDDSLGSYLSARDFRDRYARGGYTWTMLVNQSLAAYLAPTAIRRGLTPNAVTTVYLIVGVITSLLFALTYEVTPVAASLTGLIGWQLAYTLDCLDGQVARATGTTSAQGAVFDLLCDFVVHGSIILVVLPIALRPVDPTWVIEATVLLTAGWFVSIYYVGVGAVLPPNPGTVKRSLPVRALRIGRDFGLHVFVLPMATMLGSIVLLVTFALIIALELTALLLGIYSFGTGQRTSL